MKRKITFYVNYTTRILIITTTMTETRNKRQIKKVLCNLEDADNTLLTKKIVLKHDGYDRYGPRSNLYDLYVIYKDKTNRILKNVYYREEWFDGHDETYQLYTSYLLDDEYNEISQIYNITKQ